MKAQLDRLLQEAFTDFEVTFEQSGSKEINFLQLNGIAGIVKYHRFLRFIFILIQRKERIFGFSIDAPA